MDEASRDLIGDSGGALASAAPQVDRVELSVPADPAYLVVLRTATAGLAARADMTLDEIEDLRIAVDEACALVLGEDRGAPVDTLSAALAADTGLAAAADGTRADSADSADSAVGGPRGQGRGGPPSIDAVFELHHQGMVVTVSGPSTRLPEPSSFAWSVLEALVRSLEAGAGADGRRTITLRHGSPRSA